MKPHCLLDIDGTLAITDGLYLLAFQSLMAEHGVTGVDTAWFKKHVAGKVDSAVFRDVLPSGEATTDEEIKLASQRKDDLYVEHLRSKGAEIVGGLGSAFLPMCVKEQIRCVAVSNAQRGGCEAVLAHIGKEYPGPSKCIEDLVVGAECRQAKPAPDPYLEAMRRLDAPPSACIAFEDSSTGIKAGVAAGVKVVGIRTSMTDEAMRAAGATVTVADWNEVTLDFLTKLIQ